MSYKKTGLVVNGKFFLARGFRKIKSLTVTIKNKIIYKNIGRIPGAATFIEDAKEARRQLEHKTGATTERRPIGLRVTLHRIWINRKERTERSRLLKEVKKEEKVVVATRKNLRLLGYRALGRQLTRINKSYIDWNKLASKNAHTNGLVSIIVLCLDNLELTERCVESIFKAKTEVKFELLLVNNGSRAETIIGLRKLQNRHPSLRLIHSEQNLNFALGNNVGFSNAKGSVCIFLNNDTYVTDFWLDKLISPLGLKDIMAVQPALYFPEGDVQNIGIVFSKNSTLGYALYANSKSSGEAVVKNRRFQAVTAACIAVSSTDFALVEGFDPLFVNGQEDVDFCLRLINQTGGMCYCTKDSVVYHDEGRAVGRGRYYVENRLRFVERWRDKIKPDDERFYCEDGFVVKKWLVDSEANKRRGIEIYFPALEKK